MDRNWRARASRTAEGRDGEAVQPQQDFEQIRILAVLAPPQKGDQLPVRARRVLPDWRAAAVAGPARARYQALRAECLQHPVADLAPGLLGRPEELSTVRLVGSGRRAAGWSWQTSLPPEHSQRNGR